MTHCASFWCQCVSGKALWLMGASWLIFMLLPCQSNLFLQAVNRNWFIAIRWYGCRIRTKVADLITCINPYMFDICKMHSMIRDVVNIVMCFTVVWYCQILPLLFHWGWTEHAIGPVSVTQPWSKGLNNSCQPAISQNRNSAAKPRTCLRDMI